MSSCKRVSSSVEPSKKPKIGHPDGSPGKNSGGGVQIQTEINHNSTRSGERNEQITLLNGPARECTWRGVVEFDWGEMKLSEDMSAHPSATVSRKAYDFSKNLNKILHFKLHPIVECYPRIFQDAGPNRDDIALYFYPSRVDRPKGIYAKLLKAMETSNLMMQSRIDGVELLLFPSKILPADSQRIRNGNRNGNEIWNVFIWGVFRSGNS